jgi:hypothetical protein
MVLHTWCSTHSLALGALLGSLSNGGDSFTSGRAIHALKGFARPDTIGLMGSDSMMRFDSMK